MTLGFRSQDGVLSAGPVSLEDLATQYGTPAFVYSADTIRAAYQAYAAVLDPIGVRICYAVKANGNQAILRLLADQGAGMDVVSAGEMTRCLTAGVPADRIVFSGVGKTRDELARAVVTGLHQINVESVDELAVLSEVAVAAGRTVPIAVRINPDVDAKTHAKITTGRKENKFGIDASVAHAVFQQAAALPGVEPCGIALHIGSQLTDLAPYRAAYQVMADLATRLRADGIAISRLDLGGGIGIRYRDEEPISLADYADMVRETLSPLGCAMMVEPGRSLVGQAGLLLTRAVYVKQGGSRTFLILDAAMNDLIRPTLYDAWHDIVPVSATGDGHTVYDVVGPVCESGDTFATQRAMPTVGPGALVAILSAGAYGAVMGSTYNARPLPPELLVDGDRVAVVRRRQTLADLLSLEAVPEWLGN